jgi:hypothetical protein
MSNKDLVLGKLILCIISIAFVLVDWRLFFFTFSDLFLMIILLLILLKDKKSFNINKSQYYVLISTLFLVLSNVLLNYIFNTDFLIINGIKGLAKIIYYMPAVFIIHNYIKDNKLELSFLRILNITAVIICIIGIYITIAIYSNNILPYNFFWKFTRTDISSFTYRNSGGSIIRTRSVFSEPAYFGFYLNAILGILYFNKQNYRNSIFSNIIINITIFLTFSYSSIIIMVFVNCMHLLRNKAIFLYWKKYLASVLVIIAVLVLLWSMFEETIIKRTFEIISGTDGSAVQRLYGSWSYVNKENMFLGNGLGNTPPIWNIYAYILSDLGIISFVFYIIINLFILVSNFKMGMLFTILNFQKGGYLGASYWLFMLLVFIYMGGNYNLIGNIYYKICKLLNKICNG